MAGCTEVATDWTGETDKFDSGVMYPSRSKKKSLSGKSALYGSSSYCTKASQGSWQLETRPDISMLMPSKEVSKSKDDDEADTNSCGGGAGGVGLAGCLAFRVATATALADLLLDWVWGRTCGCVVLDEADVRFLWLGSHRIFLRRQASQALMMRMRCAWSRCSLVLQPRDAELVTSRPSLVMIFMPGMLEKSLLLWGEDREELATLIDEAWVLRDSWMKDEEGVDAVAEAGVDCVGQLQSEMAGETKLEP